jgi:hypothetical protein
VVFAFTSRTGDTVWPAGRGNGLNAGFMVTVVPDNLLKGFEVGLP